MFWLVFFKDRAGVRGVKDEFRGESLSPRSAALTNSEDGQFLLPW